MKKYLSIFLAFTLCVLSSKAEEGEIPVKSQEMDSLKLLSWNIYMLPPLIKFTGKRKRASAIGDTLANADYDVLVLQEAFHHGARRRIAKRLNDVYPYQIGPVFRKPLSLKTSSGIWILSKYPMTSVANVKYKQKWGFDNKMARKGAAMVRVVKNGQPFEIIGTHLNSGGPLDVRASQVRQIREELIDPHHEQGIPLIIAGDFNIERTDESGLDSMMCILDVCDYTLHGRFQYTFDETMNDLCVNSGKGYIDYVYLRNGNLKQIRMFRRIPLLEFPWSSRNRSLADHNPIELLLHYRR